MNRGSSNSTRKQVAAIGITGSSALRNHPGRTPMPNVLQVRFAASVWTTCSSSMSAIYVGPVVLRDYRRTRTHISLDKDCPEHQPIQQRKVRRVIAITQAGGPQSSLGTARCLSALVNFKPTINFEFSTSLLLRMYESYAGIPRKSP